MMDEVSVDALVPWHYGDPFAEQRLLIAGKGVTDLSHREILTISGPDRHDWLHSLLSQHLLEPFTSTHALSLSPNGHIEYDLHIVDDGQTAWIIVEHGQAEGLLAYLTKMKFRADVQVADVTDDFAVIGVPGFVESQWPTWHAPASFQAEPKDTFAYVPDRPASWCVSELIVPRELLEQELGDERVGSWAWEAHRIRAGVPRFGFETDHRTIPHEIGLISSAVHLQKGCYRGQETVARVYNLGKPPRRLVQLLIDGSTNELPSIGTPVTNDGVEVGTLTSITQDYESGPLGLAVIKRNVPLDAVLLVGAVASAQVPIVVAD